MREANSAKPYSNSFMNTKSPGLTWDLTLLTQTSKSFIFEIFPANNHPKFCHFSLGVTPHCYIIMFMYMRLHCVS